MRPCPVPSLCWAAGHWGQQGMAEDRVAAQGPLGCLLAPLGWQTWGSTEDPEYEIRVFRPGKGNLAVPPQGKLRKRRKRWHRRTVVSGVCCLTAPAFPPFPSPCISGSAGALLPVGWCSWGFWWMEWRSVCGLLPFQQLLWELQSLGGIRWVGGCCCWVWRFGGVGPELVFTLLAHFYRQP